MAKLSIEERQRIKRQGNYNFIAILLIFACVAITCLLNC